MQFCLKNKTISNPNLAKNSVMPYFTPKLQLLVYIGLGRIYN